MKIDLSKLPEGTKWIAIDSDGDVYAFEEEPTLIHRGYGGLDYDVGEAAVVGNVHD